MSMTILSRAAAAAALSVAAFAAPTAFAGEGHSGGHATSGKPGKASAASRTIEVVMHDNYYSPEAIDVKAGETVRFVIKNAGELVHEFNIGTPDSHMAHQAEMMMMVEHGVLEADRINHDAAKKMQASMGHGAHNDPNSALLEPGKSGDLVWTFPADGRIEFACNVPGHYGAGMVGEFTLTQ